jgi:AraC-like DNA-binding protein
MDINKHRRSVHSLYIKILCNELETGGIAIQESLQAAQLPMDFMEQGEGMVSIYEFELLADFAKARTGRQWIGLELAQKIITNHHGPLGYLIISSANVEEALNSLVKYVGLRTYLLDLKLLKKGNQVKLTIIEKEHLDSARILFLEGFITIVINVFHSVYGKNIKGLRLELKYPEPEYSDMYLQSFACPVKFSCEKNEIIFDAEVLLHQNIMADSKAFRLAEIECQKLYDNVALNDGLKSKIENIILSANGSFPSLNEVAGLMGMSKSTFIRRLSKANTSFKEIVDDIRHELANYYLIESEMSMENIAEKLGYADTSNFSRVFKRWHNTTPSKFRSSHQNNK